MCLLAITLLKTTIQTSKKKVCQVNFVFTLKTSTPFDIQKLLTVSINKPDSVNLLFDTSLFTSSTLFDSQMPHSQYRYVTIGTCQTFQKTPLTGPKLFSLTLSPLDSQNYPQRQTTAARSCQNSVWHPLRRQSRTSKRQKSHKRRSGSQKTTLFNSHMLSTSKAFYVKTPRLLNNS